MIKLTKTDEPNVLAANRVAWTAELLAAIAADNKEEIRKITSKYNHKDVKDALKIETNEKCAYCEAKVTDVAYGDIEHVTPKVSNRDRTFDWQNLTLACSPCNTNKGIKEDILDPYQDEPSEHIFFIGPFIKAKTDRGLTTILELELNRTPLIESRNREIERYANEIEKIFLMDNDRIKELLMSSILTEIKTRKQEFTAACLTTVMLQFSVMRAQHADA